MYVRSDARFEIGTIGVLPDVYPTIATIVPGKPAEAAGLKAGDVILTPAWLDGADLSGALLVGAQQPKRAAIRQQHLFGALEPEKSRGIEAGLRGRRSASGVRRAGLRSVRRTSWVRASGPANWRSSSWRRSRTNSSDAASFPCAPTCICIFICFCLATAAGVCQM